MGSDEDGDRGPLCGVDIDVGMPLLSNDSADSKAIVPDRVDTD
jgi:hypothetical protein